jgi:hypothetical protein
MLIKQRYSARCLEEEFCELRPYRVLGSLSTVAVPWAYGCGWQCEVPSSRRVDWGRGRIEATGCGGAPARLAGGS